MTGHMRRYRTRKRVKRVCRGSEVVPLKAH